MRTSCNNYSKHPTARLNHHPYRRARRGQQRRVAVPFARFQIAVDQINREGGIKALGGAKLKAIIADTSSENPTQAASVTRRMIDQEKAIIIAGATASAMTLG